MSIQQPISGDMLWAGLDPKPWPKDPTLTEITDGDFKGVTGFFRHNENNWRCIDLAADIAERISRKDVSIACFGGGNGAEAYSIAHHIVREKLDDRIHVITSDKSVRFSSIAKAAVYPNIMAQEVLPETRARLFEDMGNGYVRVRECFRRAVHVRRPQSIEANDIKADIIMASNVFGYLSQDMQRSTIKKLSTQARFAVAVMSGYLGTLADDMNDAGLVNYETRARITEKQVKASWECGLAVIGYKVNACHAHPR